MSTIKTAKGERGKAMGGRAKLFISTYLTRGKGGKAKKLKNTKTYDYLLRVTCAGAHARNTFPPFPCMYIMIYYCIGKSINKRGGKKWGINSLSNHIPA